MAQKKAQKAQKATADGQAIPPGTVAIGSVDDVGLSPFRIVGCGELNVDTYNEQFTVPFSKKLDRVPIVFCQARHNSEISSDQPDRFVILVGTITTKSVTLFVRRVDIIKGDGKQEGPGPEWGNKVLAISILLIDAGN